MLSKIGGGGGLDCPNNAFKLENSVSVAGHHTVPVCSCTGVDG